MGYGLKALGLAMVLFALATSTASATTLRFEGTINFANWYYWFGNPESDLMCAGQCLDSFEQATGLDFSTGSPYIGGSGTLRFLVNAETNEVLTSEIRIGNWTTSLSSVNFNGWSSAFCVWGPTIQFAAEGGTWFYTCKWPNQWPMPYPDPIQNFQYIWDHPESGRCGSYESCGLLVGTGWRMNIKDVAFRPVQVPAPGTLALLSFGLLGLRVMRRQEARA